MYRFNIKIREPLEIRDHKYIEKMATVYGLEGYAGEYETNGVEPILYNFMFTSDRPDIRGFIRELTSAGFRLDDVQTFVGRTGNWRLPKGNFKGSKKIGRDK